MKPNLLLGWIVPILALTVAAAGGGALLGTKIVGVAGAVPASGIQAQGAAGASQMANSAVKELAPIVTNLSSPDGTWVRLQTAIVYDKSQAQQIDVVAAEVGDDILAFLKTLTLAQLQGASGLQHLREDLNERAALRSDGRVRELMIEMLVVQ